MNVPVLVTYRERVLGALWGSLIGDALGVPVEFMDRAAVQADPVVNMREFGTHHQPRGTWSDDGALILCTVDSLLNCEFDTQDMGRRFVRWMTEGIWTANGEVFDVGAATNDALTRIAKGTSEWIAQLARRGDVDCLFHEFAEVCDTAHTNYESRRSAQSL
jgi:ADP-ribosylglycohydrolase